MDFLRQWYGDEPEAQVTAVRHQDSDELEWQGSFASCEEYDQEDKRWEQRRYETDTTREFNVDVFDIDGVLSAATGQSFDDSVQFNYDVDGQQQILQKFSHTKLPAASVYHSQPLLSCSLTLDRDSREDDEQSGFTAPLSSSPSSKNSNYSESYFSTMAQNYNRATKYEKSRPNKKQEKRALDRAFKAIDSIERKALEGIKVDNLERIALENETNDNRIRQDYSTNDAHLYSFGCSKLGSQTPIFTTKGIKPTDSVRGLARETSEKILKSSAYDRNVNHMKQSHLKTKPSEKDYREKITEKYPNRQSSFKKAKRNQEKEHRSISDRGHIRWFAHGIFWTCCGVFFACLGSLLAYNTRQSVSFVSLVEPIYISPVYNSVSSVGVAHLRFCFNESHVSVSGCANVPLTSEVMQDPMSKVTAVFATLAPLFGAFLTLAFATSTFWRTINLRPIGFGYLFVYVIQSMTFLFFDTDLCNKHYCNMGYGCYLSLCASFCWLISCIACAKMEGNRTREESLAKKRRPHGTRTRKTKKRPCRSRESESATRTTVSTGETDESLQIARMVASSMRVTEGEIMYEC